MQLPTLLGTGEPTTVHYTLTLPVYEGEKNYDIKNKDNVRVVGIILNNGTNYIETAFCASPDDNTAGITPHSPLLTPHTTIYDAFGREVTSTSKPGLYIIKNGAETKKIFTN